MAEIYKYAKRYRPQVSDLARMPALCFRFRPIQLRSPRRLPPVSRDPWTLGPVSSGGGIRQWGRVLCPTDPCLLCPQIMAALEANPTARRTQLQHKFEQVVALMEDNIYECYSEA